jgi:hypothetical protein
MHCKEHTASYRRVRVILVVDGDDSQHLFMVQHNQCQTDAEHAIAKTASDRARNISFTDKLQSEVHRSDAKGCVHLLSSRTNAALTAGVKTVDNHDSPNCTLRAKVDLQPLADSVVAVAERGSVRDAVGGWVCCKVRVFVVCVVGWLVGSTQSICELNHGRWDSC